MFDSISKNYDKLNDLISFGFDKKIKKSSINLLDFPKNAKILDLCTGTGDIVGLILKKYPQSKITGVDFSKKMLEIAQKKNPNANFILSDCTALPFEDETFDIVTLCWGLRNIEKRQDAIKEIYRILKSGGEILHLDFGEKNFLSKIFETFLSAAIKTIIKEKSAYKYLIESEKDFPIPEKIIKEFLEAGFKPKHRKNFLCGAICAEIFKK